MARPSPSPPAVRIRAGPPTATPRPASPRPGESLAADIRSALQPLADAERARAMCAYMRDQFAFLGIATPLRRASVARLCVPPLGRGALLRAARALWALPEREYRYAAVDLLRRHQAVLGPRDLPALLTLVLREPWWDTVDGMAAVVGGVLHRELRAGVSAQQTMDRALADPQMWVRRIAMLHQLGWRDDTDETRLFGYASTLAAEPDFFIRKAIGWALRDYARWQPEAVAAFVAGHIAALSALTVREATKHLPGHERDTAATPAPTRRREVGAATTPIALQ